MFPEAASPWVAGCVEGFGLISGMVITSHVWDFSSEEVSNPAKLIHPLIERCLTYTNEKQQLPALYWGLDCTY